MKNFVDKLFFLASQQATNRKHVYSQKYHRFWKVIRKMKFLTALVVVTATLAEKTGLSDDWLNDMNDLVAEV